MREANNETPPGGVWTKPRNKTIPYYCEENSHRWIKIFCGVSTLTTISFLLIAFGLLVSAGCKEGTHQPNVQMETKHYLLKMINSEGDVIKEEIVEAYGLSNVFHNNHQSHTILSVQCSSQKIWEWEKRWAKMVLSPNITIYSEKLSNGSGKIDSKIADKLQEQIDKMQESLNSLKIREKVRDLEGDRTIPTSTNE